MNTEFSLSILENKYTVFKEGQVLNHEQLNSVVNYLEEQTKLSRVCLTGVGVVCGLEIKIENNPRKAIVVGKGSAITTDGDLIKIPEEISLGYYKPFKSTNYHRFDKLVLELKAEPIGEGYASFNDSSENHEEINNLVVFLYLEEQIKELGACDEITCDSLGCTKEYNIRFLAIQKDLVEDEIAPIDKIFTNCKNKKNSFETLPLLSVPRVNLIPDSFNNYEELADEFQNKMIKYFSTDTGDLSLINGNYLNVALEKLQANFGDLLDGFPSSISKNWANLTKQSAIDNGFNPLDYDRQYIYDWLKDITANYNELRNNLTELCHVCCPDVDAFPKHIMLGSIIFQEFRHKFYPAKPLAHENELLEKARMLYRRLNIIINNFEVSLPLNKAIKPPIKVTPSNNYDYPLSNRAIPFYYGGNTSLQQNWNFEKYKNNQFLEIKGYHSSGTHLVENPLLYNIDENDFYRIEGHIGLDYRTVLSDLKDARETSNLPFNVVAVQLDSNGNAASPDGTLLSEYIQKHPGLTHKAGVPRGGTFVIVYNKGEKDVKPNDPYSGQEPAYPRENLVVADFCIPYICCGESSVDGIELSLFNAYSTLIPIEQNGNRYSLELCSCSKEYDPNLALITNISTFSFALRLAVKPKGGTFKFTESTSQILLDQGELPPSSGDNEYDYLAINPLSLPEGDHEIRYRVNGEEVFFTFKIKCADSTFRLSDYVRDVEDNEAVMDNNASQRAIPIDAIIGDPTSPTNPTNPTSPTNPPTSPSEPVIPPDDPYFGIATFRATDINMDSYVWELTKHFYAGHAQIVTSLNPIQGFEQQYRLVDDRKALYAFYYEIKLTVTDDDGCESTTIKYFNRNNMIFGRSLEDEPILALTYQPSPEDQARTSASASAPAMRTLTTAVAKDLTEGALTSMTTGMLKDFSIDVLKDISVRVITELATKIAQNFQSGKEIENIEKDNQAIQEIHEDLREDDSKDDTVPK